MAFKDLKGQKFNRLTVLSFVGFNKWGNARWKCECECGKITEVSSGKIIRGTTKSCGCFNAEQKIALATKHGMSWMPEYKVFVDVKKRCYNLNSTYYYNYGGRGIVVCDRWLGEHGFENFILDMGERPTPLHSLDRYPNNDGNYEPSNCRWATSHEQSRNKRNNIVVELNGVKMLACDAANETGIGRATIVQRHRKGKVVNEKQSAGKLVLDLQTGIFYTNGREAILSKGIKENIFYNNIRKANNKLAMIYA